jgi:DUF1365 family protein
MTRMSDAYPFARLYMGKVMHARMKPTAHRFSYRVFSILLDLDRLPEIDRLSSVFSVGRWNLMSFHPRDHGARDDGDLRAFADRLLRQAGVPSDGGRLFLLCAPRVLGFVFNPLSIYWSFDRGGDLRAIIYEVRNTFGEIHAYVAPATGGRAAEATIRQSIDKEFYVSPFLQMKLRYHFRMAFPDDALKVRILETDDEGPIFAAGWSGHAHPFRSAGLLRAFFSVPLMTFKIVAGIVFEALRLWRKGIATTPRPAAAPSPASFVDPAHAKHAGPQA